MYRGRYTLIGQEVSMFTRKLESQLRYQGIPFEWQLKCRNNEAQINARAGYSLYSNFSDHPMAG